MVSRLLVLSLFIMLISLERDGKLAQREGIVMAIDEDGKALCSSVNLAEFLPPPYGGLENMVCQPVWNSFLLRVSSTNQDFRKDLSYIN